MYQTVGHILHLGFFISPSENSESVHEPLLTPSKDKEIKAERGVFGTMLIGDDA